MMSIAERVARIESECEGVWGQSGITAWERARLEEWKLLPHLSAGQEAVLAEIERKAFPKDDDEC